MKKSHDTCPFKSIEEDLTRSLLQTWKRRGSSLLQVGLHSCITPDFFWDAGFDVCATGDTLEKLNASLEQTGPRVEYQFVKGHELPFDDDSFDYAFLACFDAIQKADQGETISFPSDKKAMGEILDEACRVAQKGIILLFKNKFSVHSLLGESFSRFLLQQKKLPTGRRFNPYSLWKKLKKKYPDSSFKIKSAFCLPKNLSLISSVPFGFYVGYCVTFNASVVTGLGVLTKVKQHEIIGEGLINRVSNNKV